MYIIRLSCLPFFELAMMIFVIFVENPKQFDKANQTLSVNGQPRIIPAQVLAIRLGI